ncbi:MAG: DUF2085 domain-containing protein [Myxococcales bacterium]
MRRQRTVVRLLMLLLALVPLMVPLLESVSWLRHVGQLLRSLYGLQCHQSPARSWNVQGAALPVCSRCLGIYVGLGLASALDRPRLRRDEYKAWIFIGAALLGCDVLTEWVGLRPAQAGLRFVTGLVISYGIALSVLAVLRPPSGAREGCRPRGA